MKNLGFHKGKVPIVRFFSIDLCDAGEMVCSNRLKKGNEF